jgi:hypothetical protein
VTEVEVEETSPVPGEPTEATIETAEEAEAELETEGALDESAEVPGEPTEATIEEAEMEADAQSDEGSDAAESARRSSDGGETQIGEAGPEEPATEDD